MSACLPDGSTKRSNLKSAARTETPMGLKARKQLAESPPLPITLAHVWGWFCRLRHQCGWSEAGRDPINATLIRDWCDLMGVRMAPDEVALVLELCALDRTADAKQRAAQRETRRKR